MIIRKSNPFDKVAMVTLLKQSLGEGILKKTTSIWNFKHEENHFGSSYVLLAFDSDILIGLRALMQWRWQLNDKVWQAYRAVDTATHPQYQGKGIFKKLTLHALDEVRYQSDCFVFNTPNKKSLPGYLKMGWKIVDSIPIAIVPTLFYVIPYLFINRKKLKNSINNEALQELCNKQNLELSKKNCIFTPKSVAYLKWRYEDNPMQDYVIVSNENYFLAMYIKKHRFFNELRVVEFISSTTKKGYSLIRNEVIQFAFKNNCWVITVADKNLFTFCIFGKFGPKLTFKPLTEDNTFINIAQNIYNWHYSLGDLELF